MAAVMQRNNPIRKSRATERPVVSHRCISDLLTIQRDVALFCRCLLCTHDHTTTAKRVYTKFVFSLPVLCLQPRSLTLVPAALLRVTMFIASTGIA